MKQSSLMQKGLSFFIQVSQKRLSELVSIAIDDAIGDEDIEVSGFRVKLRRVGVPSVVPTHRKVLLTLPFDVSMLRENGLFTVEGHGSMELRMCIDFDISRALKANYTSSIDEVVWIKKPILDIGVLNIPMERLIGLVINHYESIITGKIDAKLREYSNLNQFVDTYTDTLLERVNSYDLRGLHPSLSVEALALTPFRYSENNASLQGSIALDVCVEDNKKDCSTSTRSFGWMESETTDYQNIELSLSYSTLAQLIRAELPQVIDGDKELQIDSLEIKKVGKKLRIQADIQSPIKGTATISAIPVLKGMPVEHITIEDLELEVNPKNIIYKVAVPFMMGYLRKRIDALFPISLKQYQKSLKKQVLSSLPDKLSFGEMAVDFEDMYIYKADLEETRILAEARVTKPEISITIL